MRKNGAGWKRSCGVCLKSSRFRELACKAKLEAFSRQAPSYTVICCQCGKQAFQQFLSTHCGKFGKSPSVCKSMTRAGTLVSKNLSKGGVAWLIGSDVVFSCDAILIVRSSDLPRRTLTGELIHNPRAVPWQIAEATEIRGFFQLGLNRASSA
jgi:hypothetical protein